MAVASHSPDQTDTEIVHKDLALEADLARWLTTEARRLRTTPSVIISTLLEWARDEDILHGDADLLPGLDSMRTKRPRATK